MMDYQTVEFAQARMWRSFPKSIGIVISAILLAFTLPLDQAILDGFFAWILFGAIRFLIPDMYKMTIWDWGCGSLVAFPVSFWVTRWVIVGICVGIAFFNGLPIDSVLTMLGILGAFDLVMIVVFHND